MPEWRRRAPQAQARTCRWDVARSPGDRAHVENSWQSSRARPALVLLVRSMGCKRAGPEDHGPRLAAPLDACVPVGRARMHASMHVCQYERACVCMWAAQRRRGQQHSRRCNTDLSSTGERAPPHEAPILIRGPRARAAVCRPRRAAPRSRRDQARVEYSWRSSGSRSALARGRSCITHQARCAPSGAARQPRRLASWAAHQCVTNTSVYVSMRLRM